MLFISKKARLCISIALACYSTVYVTRAMEQEEPPFKRSKKEEQREQVCSWAKLPLELKDYIFSFLESAKDEKAAIENIKSLATTSKEFYNLINHPYVLDSIIKRISERFNKPLIGIALVFKSPGARWLNAYSRNNLQVEDGLNSYLVAATNLGNSTLTQFFLNAGADVNQIISNGRTLLHKAVGERYKHIVAILLKAGADVNKTDNDGKTPLYWAASKGYKEIVALLSAVK
jgi:ankyrin repeat protein